MNKLYKLVPVLAAIAAAQNAVAGFAEPSPPAAVPVPAAWLLMGIGAAALYLFRRK